MAHYQLSYGFNSTDNTPGSVINTSINSVKTETIDIKNIGNNPKLGSNIPIENTEPEKRKLPQPSEPSKNTFIYLYVSSSM